MKLDTIGQRLRHARMQKGLTQEELARLANTTQDVIQKIENGKSKRPRKLEVIAKVLDVSPAWLQFGVEEIDKLSHEEIEIALSLIGLAQEQKEALKTIISTMKQAGGTDEPSTHRRRHTDRT